jgi:hypothetical protein
MCAKATPFTPGLAESRAATPSVKALSAGQSSTGQCFGKT